MKRARGKSSAPRKRHPADVRRGLVLDAAAQLIADEGLLAATMRRIAEVSGVSLGTLTHHFPSVDALLGEALERASVSFTKGLDAQQRADHPDASARLLRLFEGMLPVRATTARHWHLWFQFWSRAVYDRTLTRVNARRYEAWRDVVRSILRAGVEAGQFRRALEVDAETHRLVALMDGLCLALALRDPALRASEARAVVTSAIAALARSPARSRSPLPTRSTVSRSRG